MKYGTQLHTQMRHMLLLHLHRETMSLVEHRMGQFAHLTQIQAMKYGHLSRMQATFSQLRQQGCTHRRQSQSLAKSPTNMETQSRTQQSKFGGPTHRTSMNRLSPT
ncbi:hypothetical protein C480_10045 [Natrialba aegyptia DSM 13077]|uniref:Uncharacterized protein n=1 Tax=Natrialba aegyptia DSM 13077 TaxID=1227491 RepID=M0B4H7_9EURY|nr:hypothetical protein C480_10045 [Natrialba aegyptia DSM 13077]